MPLTTLVAGARTNRTLPPARRCARDGWSGAARRARGRRRPARRLGPRRPAPTTRCSSRHRPTASTVRPVADAARAARSTERASATDTIVGLACNGDPSPTARQPEVGADRRDADRRRRRRRCRPATCDVSWTVSQPTATTAADGRSSFARRRADPAATATAATPAATAPTTDADDHAPSTRRPATTATPTGRVRAGRSGSGACCRSLGLAVLFGSLVLIVVALAGGPRVHPHRAVPAHGLDPRRWSARCSTSSRSAPAVHGQVVRQRRSARRRGSTCSTPAGPGAPRRPPRASWSPPAGWCCARSG